MQIDLKVIPHNEQRYETVGDWYYDMAPGIPLLHVRASKTSRASYDWLLLIHETVEALLCAATGVLQTQVDNFDIGFVDAAEGSEPGDSLAAPYHRHHTIASIVERLAAELLGVDWNDYSAEVDAL
jgi:hypothetical protein